MAAIARGNRVAEIDEERRQQYREESRRDEQEDGLKKGNKNREVGAAGGTKNRSPEWVEEGSAIYPPVSDTERRLYEIIDKWVDAAERIMCVKVELEDEIRAKDALLRATGDKITGYEAEIEGQERHIKCMEPEEFKYDHPDRMGTLEALAAAFDEGFEKGRPLEHKLETHENSPEELNELIQIAERVYIARGMLLKRYNVHGWQSRRNPQTPPPSAKKRKRGPEEAGVEGSSLRFYLVVRKNEDSECILFVLKRCP